jgi:hypothetical protein
MFLEIRAYDLNLDGPRLRSQAFCEKRAVVNREKSRAFSDVEFDVDYRWASSLAYNSRARPW